MTVAQEEARKSQLASQVQAALLTEKLSKISAATNINITSMTEFDALLQQGKIIYDDVIGSYTTLEQQQVKLAASTKLASEAEAEKQQRMTFTVEESLRVIETLDAQSNSLEGVTGGVNGFISAIDSARTALQGSNEDYHSQLTLLDELQRKFQAHQETLDRQTLITGGLTEAYKLLGLESGVALEELATKQQAAFELIQRSKEPLEQQRAAYLKWAEAALKAATATGEGIPKLVKTKAAALGLTSELGKLVTASNQVSAAIGNQSLAVSKHKDQLSRISVAIKENTRVMDSSTASVKQKSAASRELMRLQGLLREETRSLTKVQKFETLTLHQLQNEKAQLTSRMNELNGKYQRGIINAQQYNHQKSKMADILYVVNNLLGDFRNSQDGATDATIRGTQAMIESNRTMEQSISIRERMVQQSRLTRGSTRTEVIGFAKDKSKPTENSNDDAGQPFGWRKNATANNNHKLNSDTETVQTVEYSVKEINNNFNQLSSDISHLVKSMTQQRSSNQQGVTLEIALPDSNKMRAEIVDELDDRFLRQLEELQRVSS